MIQLSTFRFIQYSLKINDHSKSQMLENHEMWIEMDRKRRIIFNHRNQVHSMFDLNWKWRFFRNRTVVKSLHFNYFESPFRNEIKTIFSFDTNYVPHFGLASVSFISFYYSFHYIYDNFFLLCSPIHPLQLVYFCEMKQQRTNERLKDDACIFYAWYTFRFVAILHVVLPVLYFVISFEKRNETETRWT